MKKTSQFQVRVSMFDFEKLELFRRRQNQLPAKILKIVLDRFYYPIKLPDDVKTSEL